MDLSASVHTVLGLQASQAWLLGSQVSCAAGRRRRPWKGAEALRAADRRLGFCHSLHPGFSLPLRWELGAGSTNCCSVSRSLPICSVSDLRQGGPGELLQGQAAHLSHASLRLTGDTRLS